MSLKLADDTSGIIDRALEIAAKRRNTLLALKYAIRARRLDEADQLITELVPDEKSNRTHQSLNRIASSR